MQMPILNSFSRPLSKTGLFNGIGEEKLFDAANLVCGEHCHTRNPRKAALLFNIIPDQIIPCDNRLFFRFGNSLKEILQKEDGSLEETENRYVLNDLSPAPDRKLIQWENKLYVLPDNIQIGTDNWLPFASGYSASVAFPFTDPRTLFYSNGYYGDEYCDEASILKVGMKLRFSWAPYRVFKIQTIEESFIKYEDTTISVGTRVTLDSDIPNFNSIPFNATGEYCIPENKPILNELMLGYNHKIYFLGNSLSFYDANGTYFLPLNDFFKVGQTVKISGCSVRENNTYATITKISESSLSFDKDFTTVYEQEGTIILITPFIPEFDHLLLTEDRLFGVDNSSGKFYISALKNPFLFCDSSTLKEDSWSVKINGKATGITLWKDNIICFTEDSGFRILGYHALNFGIRQLSLNGIKSGAEDSLVRVGDTLYYFSGKGIMKYSGGSDKKISGQIPKDLKVKSAITDDSFVYMLSNDRIWVYDTEAENWWSENAENITNLFKLGGRRYLVSTNTIYLAESDFDAEVEWSFELPFLKSEGNKKIKPLSFVLNNLDNTNSVLTLYFRAYGDSNWKSCGLYNAKGEGSVKIPLPKSNCDGFKIKVLGRGTISPDSWTVFYKK